MTASCETKPKEEWQRFTLLDVLLLFPGYALGFAAARGISPDGHAAAALFVGLAIGSILAMPIVLGSHYLWRGRRSTLSLGERLWLANMGGFLCVWGIGFLTAALGFEAFIWAAIYFLAQVLVSMLALVALCAHFARLREEVPCFWTDCFGCVACVFVVPLACFLAIVLLTHS